MAALSLSMLLSSLGISIANVGCRRSPPRSMLRSRRCNGYCSVIYWPSPPASSASAASATALYRRRLLLAGIALFTAASARLCVAPQLWLLLAARMARGLGARS
ncbi:hypothetical protein M8494_11380 [Serratia ureilytica]